ncbi:MAG: HNH endonuclease [Gemmatimonadetes bacterium]|nr:HNH endonuclease [Gemmatimonadota bacterium]
MLHSRDRGKCSLCQKDLDHELQSDPHIDHLVPLARGGCNDIVNLQQLCSQCNLAKGPLEVECLSSVPGYIRRRRM